MNPIPKTIRFFQPALFLGLVLLTGGLVRSQELPPCDQRPGWRGLPRANTHYYCYEEVISITNQGEMPFTALAFTPDNRLFATRPLQGQVWMLQDTDGDLQPDRPELVAEGLTLPNALAYHEHVLYIAAAHALYRLPDGGELETLVNDLPAGTGFWTGGLTIGSDNRIYVGIGAPCDFCAWDNAEQGSILSFALDGSDRQLVAQGFRHPAALTFWNGQLYAGDSSHNSLAHEIARDELNQVIPGAHYGFPYCRGFENAPDMPSSTFDCDDAQLPLLTLETQSLPVALAGYEQDTFPNLQGKMLIALAGSSGRSDMHGFVIQAVDLTDDTPPDIGGETLIPYDDFVTEGLVPSYLPEWGLRDTGAELLNKRGAGLWPHRIYGMAISPHGWIYFSVGGGKIASLRSK